METIIPSGIRVYIQDFIDIAQHDPQAEVECKVLANKIQTKNVADRIIKTVEAISAGAPVEEHHATFSYPDNVRVIVEGAENILKVCQTNSFRGVPLKVERKYRYFDFPETGGVSESKLSDDTFDIPDYNVRFTLRKEQPLRKDFGGSPTDPSVHIRIMNRRSWKTLDGMLRIDMSMVKTRQKGQKALSDVLKQPANYELEMEIADKKADRDVVLASFQKHIYEVIAAYQESPFILPVSDTERYKLEFGSMGMKFVNPVTMERRHLKTDRPHNILTGYTVTNKADGERCLLVVVRDKKLLRITNKNIITWTGITATKDVHVGDVLDGEFIPHLNLFCVFDMYHYRGKDTRKLPLMTVDTDMSNKSRLACAKSFVSELGADFISYPTKNPIRIETKLFLAGDGAAMEEAINKMLDTGFEYETDGLIFTPRASAVAPVADRKGDTWLRVYKWKPADQNSIDFLVKIQPGESYDPVLGERVAKGTLYVSRTPGNEIIYPCETLTGEYTTPELPADLKRIAEVSNRIPSPFQPAVPKKPDAHNILIPVNARGAPIDKTGARVDDNTVIECAYDRDKLRWVVMRTRYDKTYEYRVLNMPQFGNDISVADSIWTNIHVPITDEMIRHPVSQPPDDTFEDGMYYRDNLDARDRILNDVYGFHNRIKESLYRTATKSGDSLLELAVGRAGDLHKWKKSKLSMVVGVDVSESNLTGGRQGACVRYLREKSKYPTDKTPPCLFIVGDMTQPLYAQESHYFKILNGEETAPTAYLKQFENVKEFDALACQFAIHYACSSEEAFRVFAQNLVDHCKGMFFGTCLDGQAVYSLLLGKNNHMFRSENQLFGEFVKQYDDGEGWTDEFGKQIQVQLESFERPMPEYLVPFGKMTEILGELGFELVQSTLFSDYYSQQTNITLTAETQTYSFLHRSFIFRRKPIELPKEEAQEVEVPEAVVQAEAEHAEEKKAVEEGTAEAPAEVEKPKKKRIVRAKVPVKPAEATPEIIYFFTGNPALAENQHFSNMFEAPFEVDGIKYTTVEHYFQWAKAHEFGDTVRADKILKTASPKSVKALGKKVTPFDPEKWSTMKNEVMVKALKAKFTQHPELRAKLLETGDKILAEANPRDKYWGINTSPDTEKAKDPKKWSGKNMLGVMLMELRKELSA